MILKECPVLELSSFLTGEVPLYILLLHMYIQIKLHSPILPFPDPQVKVVGLPANVQKARDLILADLDAKSERVTLKIDVPFAEHSHVIGKEGAHIKKGSV